MTYKHSVHWGINPPQKHHPHFFVKPPLNLETVQAPPFQAIPPIYWFFATPPPLPLKMGFFNEPP